MEFMKESYPNDSPNIFHRINSIAKDTLIYGLSGIISKSITLLTFPILAHAYSVEEFGTIDFLLILSALLTNFVILGQDSAIARYFNEYDNELSKKSLISNSIAYLILVSFVILVLFELFKGGMSQLFGNNYPHIKLLSIIFYTIPFSVIFNTSQAVLRYSFNRTGYIFITIGYSVATVVVVVVCTSILDSSLSTLFAGFLLVNIFFCLIGLLFIKKWIIFPQKPFLTRTVFTYAIPMGMIVLIGLALPFLERLLIGSLLDFESVGLYAAGAKIAMFITLPIGAFQAAFGPFLMKFYKESESILIFKVLLIFYACILAIGVLVLIVFSKELIVLLAGVDYIEAYIVVFPLSIGYLFQALGLFLGAGTILTNNTKLRLVSYTSALFAGTITMYLLGLKFGIYGIAIGACFGKLFFLTLESMIGQRLWPQNWNYKMIIIIVFTVILSGQLLANIHLDVLIKILVLFFIFVLLVVLASFCSNKDERNVLIELLKLNLFFK